METDLISYFFFLSFYLKTENVKLKKIYKCNVNCKNIFKMKKGNFQRNRERIQFLNFFSFPLFLNGKAKEEEN